MRKIIFTIFIVFCFVVSSSVYSQTYFYYKGTGNITSTLNWGTNPDGTGTTPSNFSTSNQRFTIQNCSIVTLNNNWTVSGSGSKVVLGNGTSACKFVIPSNYSFTGILDISATGYLNISNTSIPNLGSLNSASTVEYSGTSAQTMTPVTYGNLIISNTYSATTGGAFKVKGNLTIKFQGILNTSFSITTLPEKTFTIENGGKYIHNNATLVDTTIFAGTESFGELSTFEIQNWVTTSPVCPASLNPSIYVSGFLNNFYYGNLIWNVQQTNHYNADIANGTNLCAGDFTVLKTAWIPPKLRDFQIHHANESRTFTVYGDFNIGSADASSAEVDFYTSSSIYNTTLNLYGNFNLVNGSALWNSNLNNSNISFLKNGIQQVNIDPTNPITAIQFICFTVGNGTSNTLLQLLNSVETNGQYPNCIPQVVVKPGSTLDLNSFDFCVSNHINTSLPRFIQIDGTLICNTGYIGYGRSTVTFTSGPNSFINIGSSDGINSDGTGNIRLNGGTPVFTYGTTFVYSGAETGNMLPSSVANIVIDNPQGVELVQPLTITGNASFSSGLFDVANQSLTLNGTITRTNGTISANGSSWVTIGAGYIPDALFVGNELSNLKIIDSAGTLLGGNLIIDGTLDITGGKLNLNGKVITLSATGSLLEDYTANNVVYGSSGYIQTTLTLNNPNNNPCRGMGVIISDATHNLGVTTIKRYHSQQFASSNGNGSIRRWFDISPANNSGLNATAVFNYSASDLNVTPLIPEIDLAMYKSVDNGLTWNLVTPGTLDKDNHKFTVTEISDFSLWVLGNSNAPMPVRLVSFTSNITGRDVTLNWTTSSEQNNAGFEILRSSQNDNVNWAKVGYVNGNGTKTTPSSYSFTDKKLSKDKYVYKLKQLDYNGNFEYHNLANSVEIGTPKKFEVSQNYPNPFNPTTKVDFDLPYDSKVSIKLYDINGREVMTLVNDQRPSGYYTVQINGDRLPSGMYFYRLIAEANGEKFLVTKKMLLIK
jgi:hypothetical protein